ncbi:MAG: hypothetical protein JXL97_05335 [Bacteroidales bacterium]|nr:hypothetical protein [Bacteroidales bacterium]
MTKKQKIEILEKGLVGRKLMLSEVQKQIKSFEEQSDFGWMLTLGAQEIGMLTAIDSAQKVRKLKETEVKLIEEIRIIQGSVKELKSSFV